MTSSISQPSAKWRAFGEVTCGVFVDSVSNLLMSNTQVGLLPCSQPHYMVPFSPFYSFKALYGRRETVRMLGICAVFFFFSLEMKILLILRDFFLC